jgi:hypothetical protein
MDNQQERLGFDKAWLAGIMEGEGSFVITKSRRPNNKGYNMHITPNCCLTNTDALLIKECERILNLYELAYKTYFVKRRFNHYKDQWKIHIFGMDRTIKFISWIISELRGEKKLLAEKILNFCVMRKSKTKGFFHGIRYSEEEINLVNEILNIQKPGILNDYTSDTKKVKIESEHT